MDHSCNHQLRNDAVLAAPPPCSHLSDFRSRHGGAKPFRALQECLSIRPPGKAAIRREPDEVPRCGSCGGGFSSPSRLYACVSCAVVSCRDHALSHAESGHEIAVDVDRAELFCCVCCDQIYDRDFDAIVVLVQTSASTLRGGRSTIPPPENLRKRRRVDYRPWTPDLRERAIVGKNSTPMKPSEFPLGLRGLNNLGNTCFMNSVLQALFHTPPLRNYFLSDRHNRYFCQQKNGINKNDTKNSRLCLACDMDAMFSAVFSGDRTPYSPAKFLYSWWQHAANLASYEQQDAHEFFISMLDGIHEKVEKDKRNPQSQGCGFRSLLALGVGKCSQI